MTPERHDARAPASLSGKRPARLDAEAAVWVVRLDSGRIGEDDPALQRWLARSAAHRHAFGAARESWRAADPRRAHAGASTLSPAARRAPPQKSPLLPRFFPARRGTAAFACAAIAVIALALVRLIGQPDEATAAGEQRTVALSDGSTIRLDADSALDVQYSSSERRVTLRRGRAAFVVAHGDSRPFVVAAREGTVRDIGTAFQVDRLDEGGAGRAPLVSVAVTGGRVEVATRGGRDTLAADQAAQYDGDGARAPSRLPHADIAALTAWQKGRLRFNDVPLRDVLRTLDRYYPGHYLFAREDAAALRVSGNFDLNQPAHALDTLCDAFGLSRLSVADRLIVLSKK